MPSRREEGAELLNLRKIKKEIVGRVERLTEYGISRERLPTLSVYVEAVVVVEYYVAVNNIYDCGNVLEYFLERAYEEQRADSQNQKYDNGKQLKFKLVVRSEMRESS